MKTKFTVAFLAIAFVLNAAGATFAQKKTAGKPAPTGNALAALLPASDGVLTVDTKRALNEAVPQILSAKPEIVVGINAFLDSIKTSAGIDLRQFEQVTIGVSMKQFSAEGFDLEPVILARGKNNAGALIALAKLAAEGKYREEKVGARTVYVFTLESPKEIKSDEPPPTADTGDEPAAPPKKDSWLEKGIDRTTNNLLKELAVTAYDNNTLIAGSPARLRETLNAKARNNAALLAALNRKPNAIAAFAANLPNGLANFLDLGNDEFSKTIDSIKQVRGSMELINGSTAVSMTAKTATGEQATSLRDTLQMLQMMGKSFLGSSQRADQQVYSRMLDNAKISLVQTDVSLDLQVPQSDINILLGAK